MLAGWLLDFQSLLLRALPLDLLFFLPIFFPDAILTFFKNNPHPQNPQNQGICQQGVL